MEPNTIVAWAIFSPCEYRTKVLVRSDADPSSEDTLYAVQLQVARDLVTKGLLARDSAYLMKCQSLGRGDSRATSNLGATQNGHPFVYTCIDREGVAVTHKQLQAEVYATSSSPSEALVV
jgi:hypothetical protein